jgi:hypothetical protein
MADLTRELRAWPNDTWAKVGVDPDRVVQAVIGCWQDGEVSGLQVDDLSFEEARSLTRLAMTYVRGQLRGRLTARVARVQSTGAGCIPAAAADPTTGSHSRCTHRRTPDAVVRPRCPESWTACRRAAAEVPGSVCGRTAPVPAWAAEAATPSGQPTMLTSLEWPWPALGVFLL